MCAINGFNFKDEKLISRMNAAIKHRGPDGTGAFCNDGISLGHNRLSIIDLSDSASQPMRGNDGAFTIVFNGEIYNFKELKSELEGSYQFKTSSDTEVILAAYKKWGKDCVKKFNGIFAFVIWDARERELFLARDHIGVKPLYYFWNGKSFIFSSEIKAILEHDVPRVLNREAFNHYLRILYVPEPLTMLEGIFKLPPASCAVLKNGKFEINKYWEAGAGEYFKKNKKEIAGELRKKISEAVQRQLVSDRPLGVYLSGGIDSSIVLHNMAELRGGIDTFSVGFELSNEDQEEKFNADFNLARRTAKHYGTNHNEVILSSRDVLELFEKTVWHMDEPISNPTALAMMKLAGFAKNKADVVLGGDGGDELFGGYDRYRMSLAADYWQKCIPAFARSMTGRVSEKLRKLNTPVGIDRYALFMFQKDDILKRVISDEFLNIGGTKAFFNEKYFSEIGYGISDPAFGGETAKLMEMDRKSWLVDFSLMLTDKMTMSQGLEARVPLLDRELVEFAAKIPLKYKTSPFNTKIILKEAFQDKIPNFLFNQPKRGWFSPGAKWLRHPEIYNFAREALSEDYHFGTEGIFNWTEIEKILESHKSKKEYNFNIIWAILTFQIWAKRYNIQL